MLISDKEIVSVSRKEKRIMKDERLEVMGISQEECDNYLDNAELDAAYMLFATEEDEERRADAFLEFLNILAKRMAEDAFVPMPFEDVDHALLNDVNVEKLMAGVEFTAKQDIRLRIDSVVDKDDKHWLPLYINDRERSKGQTANIILPVAIYDVLRIGLERENLMGVVINPFGLAFTFSKEMLERFLSDYEAWARSIGVRVPGMNSMFAEEGGN